MKKKVNFVLKWIFFNGLFGYLFASLSLYPMTKSIIVMVFAVFVSLIIVVRCLFSILYYLWYWLFFKIKIYLFVQENKIKYNKQAAKKEQ